MDNENHKEKNDCAVYSVEHLAHFNCSECEKWWTIGDAPIDRKTDWYCPWCGHHHKNLFDKSPKNI